jgi:demethylmenaquinone methyltransferase/2-methoxy-6-polyprenyl-1,4-benzoquinol methylase
MSQEGPLEPHPPLTAYYDDPPQRQPFVRRIFDETAQWYDSLDDVLSLRSGLRYRRGALLRAGLHEGMRMLDVATGTGVVSRAAGTIVSDIVGLDPSMGMLLAGREKARLTLTQGAAEAIPFRSGRFDFVVIGFALRHFADLRSVFGEVRRVLAPGGRLLILEITPPRSRVGHRLLAFYMNRIVPYVAGAISGRKDAKTLMHYYWDTVRSSLPPETILRALREAGFSSAERHVELAIFSEYLAS